MHKRTLFRVFIVGLLIVLVFVTGCAPSEIAPTGTQGESKEGSPSTAPPESLTPVSIRLNWYAQTEHAGMFVALWKGYYEELGVDMTINPGGPEVPTQTLVASGDDNFGVGEPHLVIIAQSKDIPFVTVAQMHHGAYARYIAMKSSGINEFMDIKGKTVSLWLGGGEYEFLAMMEANGLTESDVNVIAQKAGMAPFLAGEVDVAEVTLHNELRLVYESGIKEEDLTIFSGADFDSSLAADGLYTTQEMIDKNPDVVQAVVTATLRGWQWAYEHPEETTQMFIDHFPEMDYEAQLYMLNVMNDLNALGSGTTKGLGYPDREHFVTAEKVMETNKLLEGSVVLEDCYTLQFWENTPAEYKVLGK